MRIRMQIAVLVSLCIVLQAGLAAQAPRSSTVTTHDANGRPVPATVSVWDLAGGNKFSAASGDNGQAALPDLIAGLADGQKMHVVVRKCKHDDGTETTEVMLLPAGVQPPPPEKKCRDRDAGFFLWGHDVSVDVEQFTVVSSGGSGAASSTTGTGRGAALQLRGFGGVNFVNSKKPGTAGFDGAVMFPFGSTASIGLLAGFEWVNTFFASEVGGGPPPSTFINNYVQFKNVNLGGRVANRSAGWEYGAHGGVTVAGSTTTADQGVCLPPGTTPTGGSNPGGCRVVSSTSSHDTVVGPYVGAYLSHVIVRPVDIFLEGDYRHLKNGSTYDLNVGELIIGLSVHLPL